MKSNRLISFSLITLVILIALSACNSILSPSFDSSLLIGKWHRPVTASDGTQGYDCYRYDSSGNGATWDTSEDVTEDEGQIFTWTLKGEVLTLIHIGELGQKIPKTYTVEKLNSTTLSFRDDYNKVFSFSKFE